MKLTLFLDIDGVLNCWGENASINTIPVLKSEIDFFNDVPLNIFANTVKDVSINDLEIVICSTWRKIFTLLEFKQMTKKCPQFSEIFKFVPLDRYKTGNAPNGYRGDEIKQYCEDFNITNFICVDDDSDFHDFQRLCKCNSEIGFSVENSLQLQEILKQ